MDGSVPIGCRVRCAITRCFYWSRGRIVYESCPPAKSVVPLRVRRAVVVSRDARPEACRAVTVAGGETAEAGRGVHQEDQGVHAGSADQHRARRSSSGVGHDPDAAEVLRPHARHARRADLRQRHPALLRSPRQGVRSHHDVDHRQDRGRPRHGPPRRRRRSDHQADRQVQRHARVADRSAQDDGGAGAAADQDRKADLLGDKRHALGRNRRPGDAPRAAVPSRRRRDALHPGDPQQRHHAHHPGHRGRRPREARRHLLLQQEAAGGGERACR